jgi:hypothetical protein
MNPAEWYVGPAHDQAIDVAALALRSTSGITAGGSSKAGWSATSPGALPSTTSRCQPACGCSPLRTSLYRLWLVSGRPRAKGEEEAVTPTKDLTLARRIAEEIQRAAPHFEVRERPDSGYVTVRVRDWVWVYVQPLFDYVRVRFELPDDGTAEQVAARLTCKVAPQPGPIQGRSDSRLGLFVTSVQELHECGVCWQIPTLLEAFRRLPGRARGEQLAIDGQ